MCRLDTYHFTVEIVLAHHDRVDRLGIDKVEKGKAARAAGVGIAHHGAVAHLAKLRKVASQRIYKSIRGQQTHARLASTLHDPRCTIATFGGVPVETADKHFAVQSQAPMRAMRDDAHVPTRIAFHKCNVCVCVGAVQGAKLEPHQVREANDDGDGNDADDDEDDEDDGSSGDDDECEYGDSEGISDGGDVHMTVVTVTVTVTVTTRIMAMKDALRYNTMRCKAVTISEQQKRAGKATRRGVQEVNDCRCQVDRAAL